MPGRKYTLPASAYRYGFNGKENDNEVKGEGNQQDYGFRIYDPRLGRFLSVDPLDEEYPWYTPYQFAGNTPIQATDLDGLEPAYHYFNDNGKMVLMPAGDNLPRNVPREHLQFLPQSSKAEPGIMPEWLSLTLDFIPIVQTIKGGIEGAVGYDAAGNQLSPGDRALGVVPYVGKAKKVLKVVKAADKINDTRKVVKSVTKSQKVVAGTEKAIVKTKKELDVLRNKAVDQAWKNEKKRIKETGTGSRDWTVEELEQLNKKGTIDGYHGHHKKPVKDYPDDAGDPENIVFLKSDNPKGGGAKKGSEHHKVHHPDK